METGLPEIEYSDGKIERATGDYGIGREHRGVSSFLRRSVAVCSCPFSRKYHIIPFV